MPAARRPRREVPRPAALWWVTFGLFVAVGVIWNLAQPLLSGADEPAHFVEAEAVWTGQLLPRVVPVPSLAMDTGVVHVRALGHDDVDCYDHHPNRPASCTGGVFTVSRRPEWTTTYVAREPPLPAVLNGLPVRIAPGPLGLRLGRLLDSVLSAAFLATALALAAGRRRPFLALGVVVAFTPEALAETGVLGSSQLEIGAAVLVWTLVALLLEGERPTRGLLALLTGASAALALARPISFVWVALAGLALLAGSRRRCLAELLRARATLAGLAVVAAAMAVAVGWYFWATAPANPAFVRHIRLPANWVGDLAVALRGARDDWLQAIGQTGGDYSGPWWMTLLWTALLGATVGTGLLWASKRRVVVVVLLVVALLGLPTAVKAVEVPHLWLFWHGRYDIPTLAGVTILAASALDRVAGRVAELGRLATAGVALAGLGQVAEFAGTLRRFCVGEDGPLNPLRWGHGWQPPLPALVLLPLGAVVIGAAYWWLRSTQRAVLRDLAAASGRAGTRAPGRDRRRSGPEVAAARPAAPG